MSIRTEPSRPSDDSDVKTLSLKLFRHQSPHLWDEPGSKCKIKASGSEEGGALSFDSSISDQPTLTSPVGKGEPVLFRHAHGRPSLSLLLRPAR